VTALRRSPVACRTDSPGRCRPGQAKARRASVLPTHHRSRLLAGTEPRPMRVRTRRWVVQAVDCQGPGRDGRNQPLSRRIAAQRLHGIKLTGVMRLPVQRCAVPVLSSQTAATMRASCCKQPGRARVRAPPRRPTCSLAPAVRHIDGNAVGRCKHHGDALQGGSHARRGTVAASCGTGRAALEEGVELGRGLAFGAGIPLELARCSLRAARPSCHGGWNDNTNGPSLWAVPGSSAKEG
jgi:hypothetical protein